MPDWVAPLLTLLLGGGLAGTIVALIKVTPERNAIVVTASQGAITSVVSALKITEERAIRAEQRVVQLEAELRSLQGRIKHLEDYNEGRT